MNLILSFIIILFLQPVSKTLDIYTLVQSAEDGLLANCNAASETELTCVHGKNIIFAARIHIKRNEGFPDTVDTTFTIVKHVLTDGVKMFPETQPYFQWLIDTL